METVTFSSVAKIDDNYLKSIFHGRKNALYKLYREKASQEEINKIKFDLAIIQREFQIRIKRKEAHQDYLKNLKNY